MRFRYWTGAAAALATQLGTVDGWLGLAGVRVAGAGDLVQPLTRALA